MLALVATIAGSIIAGYSSYKIYMARTGRDRKLRDMEVLRRFNVPPKKQVRVWSVLMVLGLVLLTPGLGFLLSYDPISCDAAYSNLRATSSGNPMVVPPSEKLDSTPRVVDKDESSRTVFFASSGGSSKRSSSSGGTRSVSSSSENAASVDETSSKSYINDTASSGGSGSTHHVSEINETTDLSGTKPILTEPLTESGKIDTVPEKTSKGGASETIKAEGEAESILTETSTKPVVIEAATEIGAASGAIISSPSKSSISENVPKSTEAETLAEPAIIDAASEKRTAADVVGDLAAETEPLPTSKETSTEPVVVDIGSEKGDSMAETKPASTLSDTFTEPVVVDVGLERSTALETSGSSEIGDELESNSSATPSEPSDPEVESDQPATSLSSGAFDPKSEPDQALLSSAIESSETSSISDQTAVPAAKTVPQINEVKKLTFGENPLPETNSTGNDSEDGNESPSNPLPDLGVPSVDFKAGPVLDTFGKEFDFASTTPPGLAIDDNGTSRPVSIMEFEKIDLGSNRRVGSGLTPTSPFG